MPCCCSSNKGSIATPLKDKHDMNNTTDFHQLMASAVPTSHSDEICRCGCG